MKLEDQNHDPTLLDAEIEGIFNEQYRANLRGDPPLVRLQSKDFYQQAFGTLIYVLQKCTSPAKGVLISLKRLPMHSLAVPLLSCS